jgi:hypothetical protein
MDEDCRKEVPLFLFGKNKTKNQTRGASSSALLLRSSSAFICAREKDLQMTDAKDILGFKTPPKSSSKKHLDSILTPRRKKTPQTIKKPGSGDLSFCSFLWVLSFFKVEEHWNERTLLFFLFSSQTQFFF